MELLEQLEADWKESTEKLLANFDEESHVFNSFGAEAYGEWLDFHKPPEPPIDLVVLDSSLAGQKVWPDEYLIALWQWLRRPQSPRISQPLLQRPGKNADVMEALCIIPPDVPYNDWIMVGMALHDGERQHDIANGLDYWHRWTACSRDPEHQHRVSRIPGLYRGFKREGITLGSLFALAKQHGYKK